MQANVQWQSLNSFTYKTGHTQTHTHTQKEMEPAGLYWTLQPWRIGKLGVRVWLGTWPPRAVLPTRTCVAPGRERESPARALQHNPPRWDSNPRTRIQRAQPGSYERPDQPRTRTDDQESPADQKQGTTSKEPRNPPDTALWHRGVK